MMSRMRGGGGHRLRIGVLAWHDSVVTTHRLKTALRRSKPFLLAARPATLVSAPVGLRIYPGTDKGWHGYQGSGKVAFQQVRAGRAPSVA